MLPVRRLRPALRTVVAAATCALVSFGTVGCGIQDLVGQSQATEAEVTTPTSMTKANVKSFYGLVNQAYAEQDAARMCQLHDPAFIEKILKQAAKRGVALTTCEDIFRTMFVAEPEGYADRLSNVRVKGRRATLMSGDDLWHIGMVDGRMLVVDQKTGKSGR